MNISTSMHNKHNATCPWLITARVYPRAIRCSDVAKFDPIEISLLKSALCRTFTGSLVIIRRSECCKESIKCSLYLVK